MRPSEVGTSSGAAFAFVGAEAVAGDAPSVEAAAELLVEADREERRTARQVADVWSEVARQKRRQALDEQRAAAQDGYSSALLQACVGGAVAVLRGVAAVAGAALAAPGTEVAATAGTAAAEAGADAGGAAATGVGEAIGSKCMDAVAGGLEAARPLFDEYARGAERHRIEAQGRSDEGQAAADREQRAESDAEAARSARRAHIDGLGRTIDLIERGRTIAIGRESV